MQSACGMLFNSYIFVLVFLPLVLLGFHLGGRFGGRRLVVGWLVLSSLVYYGWWRFELLVLLGGSILANYGLGLVQHLWRERRGRGSRLLMVAAVAGNLGLLVYYKYAGFLVEIWNELSGGSRHFAVFLPLAISFFTFQQLAYQVDVYRGTAQRRSLLDYCLFVVFFPQLIAGPIVHHATVIPQYRRLRGGLRSGHLAAGLTLFAIGLFKKVILADTLALAVDPVFDGVHQLTDPATRGLAEQAGVTPPTLLESWGAGLGYTAQLYLDFSGYSDMAIGLARCFGIRLPLNFNSPLKATSLIDFWRRWHITLSHFLRDYLYIPLGGNRYGRFRRYLNVFVTMLLGGIWHGAGWPFVCWGALHGVLLMINHAWREAVARLGLRGNRWWHAVGTVLTFLCVTVGFTLFRSENLGDFHLLLVGMSGFSGVSLSDGLAGPLGFMEGLGVAFEGTGRFPSHAFVHLAVAYAFIWGLPNASRIMHRDQPTFTPVPPPTGLLARLAWRPGPLWAVITITFLLWSIWSFSRVSEFLYFQF